MSLRRLYAPIGTDRGKKSSAAAEALGHSLDGLSTSLHVRVEGNRRLKQYRRIATGYEKRAANYAAMVISAAVIQRSQSAYTP